MITSHIEGLGALILVLDQYGTTVGDNEMMSESSTLDAPEREDYGSGTSGDHGNNFLVSFLIPFDIHLS